MTNKRFRKLMMAFGCQRNDLGKNIEDYKKECNERGFRFDYYSMFIDSLAEAQTIPVPHPAYEKKFKEAFTDWCRYQISDGEAVRVMSRCVMATKDLVVIDKRKKDTDG